jgi:hypothetical protein
MEKLLLLQLRDEFGPACLDRIACLSANKLTRACLHAPPRTVRPPASSTQSAMNRPWLSSNPNIILGCTTAGFMARIEDPAGLD